MKLGLDFDNTITADWQFWQNFVKLAHEHNHQVVLVTNRSGPDEEVESWCRGAGVDNIVFADDEYKSVAAHKRGHNIQVWIDDTPSTIQQVYMFCPSCGTIMEDQNDS